MSNYKTLFEKLSPESLAIIEEERKKYPNTVQSIEDDLRKNYFPNTMQFNTALWLGFAINRSHDPMKIYQLFDEKTEEEVGS